MATNKPRNLWQVENVDEQTRRRIKAYAAMNGITIPEALKRLMDLANVA